MSKSTTLLTENPIQGELFSLSPVHKHRVEVSFTSADTSSYGGLLLLRETEQQTQVIKSLCSCLTDTRQVGYISHTYRELLSQRILQIAAGYEDADDCDLLRQDSILKMCCGRSATSHDLASQPTMSRLENNISKEELYKMGCCFISLFLSSYESAPKMIVLDIDDSNFNTFGDQQYTLFSNYYKEHCYMPFFIFEGCSGKLILPLLRPGRRNKDINIFGILRRVIELIRLKWKKTVIVIRGDSHFCNDKMMSYCEQRKGLYYITGMIGFAPHKKAVDQWVKEAESRYLRDNEPVRMYRSFYYGAVAWQKKRRVVVSIRKDKEGLAIRFIISNFSPQTTARCLYEKIYTQRGTMELYIKEVKSHLKGRRMSCAKFASNQFRLFLYGAAYWLMHSLKTNALRHTVFQGATIVTIQQKIILVSAHIKVYKTKIKIELPQNYPHKEEFANVMERFRLLRMTG